MNSNLYDADKLREIFTEYLVGKSLRKTTERFTILKHICEIQGHFDIEMIRQRLDEENFHVSRASVYNTIDTLMDANLVVRHQFTTKIVQYELKHVAMHHHHLICSYCNSVRELKNDKFIKQMEDIKITKFSAEHFSLYIYGICSKCKFRLKNNIK